ncbi:hypothetical protein PPERSA_09993 [Pseudocohnilembus persalinus]|uniref:Uncharacterized protein n=1 Tax=Pseudocohnilembus persalinus TaxID=266149 RepID=A0A0V0QJS0_PSEPJ|nr:hypothetical protein PPERSA_09993 [Pseudocohnilembus persalinus]|eukprot:KRX02376.1 hypothetical protein PPERSA_09993 [Pseudocohnilembus persalinus]
MSNSQFQIENKNNDIKTINWDELSTNQKLQLQFMIEQPNQNTINNDTQAFKGNSSVSQNFYPKFSQDFINISRIQSKSSTLISPNLKQNKSQNTDYVTNKNQRNQQAVQIPNKNDKKPQNNQKQSIEKKVSENLLKNIKQQEKNKDLIDLEDYYRKLDQINFFQFQHHDQLNPVQKKIRTDIFNLQLKLKHFINQHHNHISYKQFIDILVDILSNNKQKIQLIDNDFQDISQFSDKNQLEYNRLFSQLCKILGFDYDEFLQQKQINKKNNKQHNIIGQEIFKSLNKFQSEQKISPSLKKVKNAFSFIQNAKKCKNQQNQNNPAKKLTRSQSLAQKISNHLLNTTEYKDQISKSQNQKKKYIQQDLTLQLSPSIKRTNPITSNASPKRSSIKKSPDNNNTNIKSPTFFLQLNQIVDQKTNKKYSKTNLSQNISSKVETRSQSPKKKFNNTIQKQLFQDNNSIYSPEKNQKNKGEKMTKSQSCDYISKNRANIQAIVQKKQLEKQKTLQKQQQNKRKTYSIQQQQFFKFKDYKLLAGDQKNEAIPILKYLENNNISDQHLQQYINEKQKRFNENQKQQKLDFLKKRQQLFNNKHQDQQEDKKKDKIYRTNNYKNNFNYNYYMQLKQQQMHLQQTNLNDSGVKTEENLEQIFDDLKAKQEQKTDLLKEFIQKQQKIETNPINQKKTQQQIFNQNQTQAYQNVLDEWDQFVLKEEIQRDKKVQYNSGQNNIFLKTQSQKVLINNYKKAEKQIKLDYYDKQQKSLQKI